jgi:membrane protein DedA with SNARE-associated domain
MGLTEFLATHITALIEQVGYLSVTFLMTLESMIFPIPSEAVMPFTGFLVEEGTFNFMAVTFFSTLGSVIGSALSYMMGYFGGKPFVHKFGKFFLLNEHHLEKTQRFFHKHGEITILIGRLIPVVRHFISISAGLGRMKAIRFFIFTIIGASAWNSFLCFVGYLLKSNWSEVMKYSSIIDVIIVVIILGLVGYFIFCQIRARKKRRASELPGDKEIRK